MGHGNGRQLSALMLSTVAFTACFAVWMTNGVLVTFLVDARVFTFDKVQVGWLMGIPVLTGALMRLPMGLLTDRFGGRVVFPAVMLVAAASMWALSFATSFAHFVVGSLGFGLAGSAFAVGVAFTAVWFPKERQGLALGIFGAGNAGSAITSLGGPVLLKVLTGGGQDLEGWRHFPRAYAGLMVALAVVFVLFTKNKKPAQGQARTLARQLAPLRSLRVWRFGLYYFLVFGCFVALAQWLIPYYVSAYGMSLAMAGLLASVFSFPSGVVRALGGWLSDRLGPRTTMYWVLGVCALCCLLLVAPRMDITSPGEGVAAKDPGTVTAVSPDAVVVDGQRYALRVRQEGALRQDGQLVLPASEFWQEPVVRVGDVVQRKQLLARGTTHIYFQANVWVFTFLAFVVGIAMGIGKAAVYKYIPEYFPEDVGVVGGIVGVIGGLGGFVCPILFGYLLQASGLWTSAWVFLFLLSLTCLVWLHAVVRQMMQRRAPRFAQRMEDLPLPSAEAKSPRAAPLEGALTGGVR